MSLSLQEKQNLYHGLAQLVRTGIPFPTALDKIAPSARGSSRRLVEAARKSLGEGHTVGEAFARQGDLLTPLEISVVSAVEKSGQLDRGLSELSEYFGALDKSRRAILARCAYPFFLLHFGVLVLNVPTFILKSSEAYVHDITAAFVVFYGVVIIMALAVPLLRALGAENPMVDRLLITVPLLGHIRRCFALSRFCTVYGMQLDAGINVMDALAAAGRAAVSGLVGVAAERALPGIRSGAPAGPLLAASHSFPSELTQAIIVGEETGSLDDELRRHATTYREKGIRALELFADWLPKLIYAATVAYLGWKMVGLIMGTIAPLYRNALGE